MHAIDGAHIEVNRVYADKGSFSYANRWLLRKRKIKSAICIERTRTNRSRHASYSGTVKVNAQVMLKSIGMNLKELPTKFL